MALPGFLPHFIPPRSSSCLLSTLHNPWPLSGRRIDGAAVRASIRGSLAPTESAVAEFWQWMSKKGAVSASSAVVKPEFVPEGLGLVAQRDIPRNEVVVEVSKSLWIDADTVAASEIGRLCGGLRPWVAIALFLLREKALGPASPWHPYLNILPTTTNSTLFCAGQKRSSLRYKGLNY